MEEKKDTKHMEKNEEENRDKVVVVGEGKEESESEPVQPADTQVDLLGRVRLSLRCAKEMHVCSMDAASMPPTHDA